MRPSFGWWFTTTVLPALLVLGSLPLLALAVIGRLIGEDVLARQSMIAGALLWAAGIGWGILVNRVGPSLKPV